MSKSAYKQGVSAQKASKPHTANPYDKDSDQWIKWNDGWNEALYESSKRDDTDLPAEFRCFPDDNHDEDDEVTEWEEDDDDGWWDDDNEFEQCNCEDCQRLRRIQEEI